MEILLIAISLIYATLATLINKLVKNENLYRKTTETAKILKSYKITQMTQEQIDELWSLYKFLLKENMKIFGTSILLFVAFYYYVVPMVVGIAQQLNFVIYSIILSIAINIGVYLIKKVLLKNKNIQQSKIS